MGHYTYFGLPPKLKVETVDTVMRALAAELWDGLIDPGWVEISSIMKGEGRLAKWAFMVNEPGWADAAFSLSLVYEDGTLKLECKMPVSDKGKQWQRELRKALVRRLWGRD